MKLVSYSTAGAVRIGCINGEQVVDLNYACLAQLEADGAIRAKQIAEAFVPANMVEFLQGGTESMELAKRAVDYALNHVDTIPYPVIHNTEDVKIEAPVLNPSKIICVGHNYREHIL
ncbi:hypothetical protein D3C77_535340 [compost metagenome]